MSDAEHILDPSPILPTPKRRSLLRRLGCGIGLLIWAILLLLPCIAILLISQGEIAVQLGSLPDQSLRVWLIQDAAERGIGIAYPSVHSGEDSTTCLQTDTNFMLWMGKGETSSYCECFVPDGDNWKSVRTTQASCNP